MAIVAVATTSLVAFTLPSTPRSARAARFYVRAALGCHDLGDRADDIETVTSELVSNAVTHARAAAVDVDLLLLKDGSGAVAVVVTDPCARPPVRRDPAVDAEHGRGLLMVEALATRWGWVPQNPGKAVFAVFIRQG
jgi:anti-sigma regulatory factor (Ser/Thr protein kinase)